MAEKLDQSKMLQVLDWAYEKSLNGLPGTLSAEEYLNKNGGNAIKTCDSLVNWQV